MSCGTRDMQKYWMPVARNCCASTYLCLTRSGAASLSMTALQLVGITTVDMAIGRTDYHTFKPIETL